MLDRFLGLIGTRESLHTRTERALRRLAEAEMAVHLLILEAVERQTKIQREGGDLSILVKKTTGHVSRARIAAAQLKDVI